MLLPFNIQYTTPLNSKKIESQTLPTIKCHSVYSKTLTLLLKKYLFSAQSFYLEDSFVISEKNDHKENRNNGMICLNHDH